MNCKHNYGHRIDNFDPKKGCAVIECQYNHECIKSGCGEFWGRYHLFLNKKDKNGWSVIIHGLYCAKNLVLTIPDYFIGIEETVEKYFNDIGKTDYTLRIGGNRIIVNADGGDVRLACEKMKYIPGKIVTIVSLDITEEDIGDENS